MTSLPSGVGVHHTVKRATNSQRAAATGCCPYVSMASPSSCYLSVPSATHTSILCMYTHSHSSPPPPYFLVPSIYTTQITNLTHCLGSLVWASSIAFPGPSISDDGSTRLHGGSYLFQKYLRMTSRQSTVP